MLPCRDPGSGVDRGQQSRWATRRGLDGPQQVGPRCDVKYWEKPRMSKKSGGEGLSLRGIREVCRPARVQESQLRMNSSRVLTCR